MTYIGPLLDFYEILKKWVEINIGWYKMIFTVLKKKVGCDLDHYLMYLKPFLLNNDGYLEPKNLYGLMLCGLNIVKKLDLI